MKNYTDVLFEQAGGAIIEGAQKIINKNYRLDIPQAVEYATGQYKEDNDWLDVIHRNRVELVISQTFLQQRQG